MSTLSRRAFALSLPALALAACGNRTQTRAIDSNGRIDARADATLSYMFSRFAGTRELADKSAGMLVMPVMTEAGLWIGGAYGEGVLRIRGASVDYYSAAKASAGLQLGAQQYTHVIFFMTPGALANFRQSEGWAAGANVHYAVSADGKALAADTNTTTQPIIAVVFAQAGARVGATLEGVKYTRITAAAPL